MKRKDESIPLPLINVILHNSNIHKFDDVVKAVALVVLHLDNRSVIEKVREAHDTGRSVLVSTHRERAELYVDQFATLDMTVTMENAS